MTGCRRRPTGRRASSAGEQGLGRGRLRKAPSEGPFGEPRLRGRSQNALATGSATTSATGDSPGVLDADEISSELAEIAVPDDRSESDGRNAGTSDRFDNESPNQSTFYDTAPNESLNAKMISEQPETNGCSSGEELADILSSAWI